MRLTIYQDPIVLATQQKRHQRAEDKWQRHLDELEALKDQIIIRLEQDGLKLTPQQRRRLIPILREMGL